MPRLPWRDDERSASAVEQSASGLVTEVPMKAEPFITASRHDDAPETILEQIRREIDARHTSASDHEWRLALADALLAGHLDTLKRDFVRLLDGAKLNDLEPARRETMVSVFYGTLQDTYIGVDSHYPTDFFEIYPTLLEHLRPTGGQFRLSSKWNSQCHAPQAVRIIPIDDKELQRDYERNSAVWETYLQNHQEHQIKLLQVSKSLAIRTLQDRVPGAGWTTDIGIWARTCALLFEEPSQKKTRSLQLLTPGTGAWAPYLQYVKDLLNHARRIRFDGRHGITFEDLPEQEREDMQWVLEAIFDQPLLAHNWKRFVSPLKRMQTEESAFLTSLMTDLYESSGRKLRVLDAAAGVGAESVWIHKNATEMCDLVVSNEVDWTLARQAQLYARESRVDLELTMYDWRHIAPKLTEEGLEDKFDLILVLGNSLTCLPSLPAMELCLKNFAELLSDDGLLAVDERNYRLFYRNKRFQRQLIPPDVVYVGDIRAKPDPARMGKLGEDHMYLQYYLPPDYMRDAPLGDFRVFPFSQGQVKNLLQSAGLETVQTFSNFRTEYADDASFYTYVAQKRVGLVDVSPSQQDDVTDTV